MQRRIRRIKHHVTSEYVEYSENACFLVVGNFLTKCTIDNVLAKV